MQECAQYKNCFCTPERSTVDTDYQAPRHIRHCLLNYKTYALSLYAYE